MKITLRWRLIGQSRLLATQKMNKIGNAMILMHSGSGGGLELLLLYCIGWILVETLKRGIESTKPENI